MDPSVLGTGSIVLNRANAAPNVPDSGPNTVPWYSGGAFSTPNTRGQVEPVNRYLQLTWALPTGSPADFPIVLNYHSNSGVTTEYGVNWSAPYHRYAEQAAGTNVKLYNPQGGLVVYGAPDAEGNCPGSPNNLNNTLNGSPTTSWTETQPDGTTFNYNSTGVLQTIRNNAGVRWTLTWNAGFSLVQSIVGPFGRRTSFAYDGSNNIRRIQDPGGRITSLTVNASNNLVKIVTPELCTTSLIYDGSHDLIGWIDPLGFRTTYVYDPASAASVLAVVQPLGQRTTYSSYISSVGLVRKDTIRPRNGENHYWTVVTYPNKARTTITLGVADANPLSILNPVGNLTSYAYTFGDATYQNTTGYLSRVTDARGHMTTISYQPVGSGKTAIFPTGIQSPVAQYQYKYNSNNQLSAVVDELGNRSSLVWDSHGNRIAVIDPYNKRTSYLYDSMARLVAVENALGLRATQLYDSQGRLAADINPLGFRTSYAYDSNSQLLRVQDPLGHITTTLHDSVNRLTARIDPLGNRVSYTYDVDSRLIRTTNPIGAITTQMFDANSRLIATIDPAGITNQLWI